MRQKDTIEAERNSLASHREKQASRIEQMQALEQTLRQQVVSWYGLASCRSTKTNSPRQQTLDKAVAASHQDLVHVRQDMGRLEDELHFMSMTSEGHQRRIAEVRFTFQLPETAKT